MLDSRREHVTVGVYVFSKISETSTCTIIIAPITVDDTSSTVKILKFGTPQTIAIIVLEMELFDLTLH